MMQLKNARSRRSRLFQLEAFVEATYVEEPTGPISAPEMLEYYQRCAKTRLFNREPDFPEAVAEYARQLETIPVHLHVPTDDFEPDKRERERLRLWHLCNSIPELRPIQDKLHAMANRAFQGLEGVSEVEFEQKKAWFKANSEDLPMHYMVAEDGTTEPKNNTVDTVLRQGPTSRQALNTMIVLREWEKGNFDKSTTWREYQRRQQEREAKLANGIR